MKMMMFSKYATRVCAVATCSAALATAPMLAQKKGDAQQQVLLNSLTNAVGLTPDQVTQVQAINAEAMKQTLDVRTSGDDPATIGSKIKAIQRTQRANIKALLTDEQRPKYDAYLAMQHGAPGEAHHTAPPQ